MRKFGIKPYRRKARFPIKKKDQGKPAVNYPNLTENIKVPDFLLCPLFPLV